MTPSLDPQSFQELTPTPNYHFLLDITTHPNSSYMSNATKGSSQGQTTTVEEGASTNGPPFFQSGLPTLHNSSPLHRPRRVLQATCMGQHTLYLLLSPTIIQFNYPSQLIDAYLDRPLWRREDSKAIRHKPIDTAESLKHIFSGYLSHVALVSPSSPSYTLISPHVFN